MKQIQNTTAPHKKWRRISAYLGIAVMVGLAIFLSLHPNLGSDRISQAITENPFKVFRVVEQYQIDTDEKIIYASDEELWGDSEKLNPFEAINSVNAQIFCENGFRLIYRDAVLYFGKPSEQDLENYGFDSQYCPLYRIEAFGYSVEIDNLRFPANQKCSLYAAADGRIVFSRYFPGRTGDTFLFSEDGIWELHNAANTTAENYNESIYSFERSEDGQLRFRCSPRKFIYTYLSIGELLPCCVSRNELWRTSGSVTFDGAEPVFTVEEKIRVGEEFDEERLEAERAAYHQMISYTAEPEWESLDELFAYNAERYEEWLGE